MIRLARALVLAVLAAVVVWALHAALRPEAVRAWLDTTGLCG